MTPGQSYLSKANHQMTSFNKSGSAGGAGVKNSNFFASFLPAKTTHPLLKPDPTLISKLLREEADERYRYLIRHGNVQFVEAESLTLFVELSQIQDCLVVYRRPSERVKNADKLSLEHRGLKHVPLLEGEEKLRHLNLSQNEITRIENIVSLPSLNFLDISQNKLAEISKMPAFINLRVLILSKNLIERIENLEGLVSLEVLDLNDNRILKIENLGALRNLRVLNLSNNLVTSLDMPFPALKGL